LPPGTQESDMDDPYDLQRFVDAQNPVITQAFEELREGHKRSHWMWFVFPQIEGLRSSATAERFAISSLAEAQAYLKHPVLSERLRQATRLVNDVERRSIEEIFGYPDYMKFRSSMTLFSRATEDNEIFLEALRKYFAGEADPKTLQRI
jgi:uncharacterized protein (DUF1810 family)